MIITHIWRCADQPLTYAKIDVDEKWEDSDLGLVNYVAEQAKVVLAGDHAHIFNAARSESNGTRNNVFHECPGKDIVLGDHIVLGEE